MWSKANKSIVSKDEKGFSSAQFIVLMGFSILFLTGFLNMLFIEFQRNSVLGSLREAARAGTHIGSLKSSDVAVLNLAKKECKDRGENALKDLFDETKVKVECEIVNVGGIASMRASLIGTPNAVIVPWALPYENIRLKNLTETFVQRESAND